MKYFIPMSLSVSGIMFFASGEMVCFAIFCAASVILTELIDIKDKMK